MDRSIDLVVCDFHTAWQVFVQAIVAPLTSPLLPFHPKVFLFGLFLLRNCRSLTFSVFCCTIFVLCLHSFLHRFASLASPLLPSHLKLLSLRALPFVHLMLFVFLCFVLCCFVLCPRPSFFCLMPFCANMGKPKTNITAAMRNLLSGVLHQPYQLHLVALFCVFHSLFLRRFFLHSMLFVFVRSLFCFLRPLALLSCVVFFFGEKPKQKGSPKPRLASLLKSIRFEK